MKKVGKVINIKGNKVYIVTKDKEFCILKRNSTTPKINSIYAGEVYNHKSAVIATIMVILLSILIFLGFKAYDFFTVKTQFIVDMGGRFRISVNQQDKITHIEGKNSIARSVLEKNSHKYENLDTALSLLLEQCIQDKKIVAYGDVTFYMIKGSEEDITDLTKFNNTKEKNNLYLNINVGGDGFIE